MSKEIEITNFALTHQELGLIAMLSQLKSLKAPGTIQWNTVRTLRSLAGPNDDFWKARNEIFEKWCLKGEDGKPKVTKDNQYDFENEEVKASCLKEITELSNQVIKIEIFPVNGTEITSVSGITGDLIIGLGDFIHDDTPKKAKNVPAVDPIKRQEPVLEKV